jgi:hypothetical protein
MSFREMGPQVAFLKAESRATRPEVFPLPGYDASKVNRTVDNQFRTGVGARTTPKYAGKPFATFLSNWIDYWRRQLLRAEEISGTKVFWNESTDRRVI